MQTISPRHAPSAYVHASDLSCPCCQGKLVREHRRIVDRLYSLVRPIKRYRCDNFACQWLGNMAQAGDDMSGSDMAAGVQTRRDMGQSSRVPVSFVINMVLVAAAIVFIIVYCSTESASWLVWSEQVFGSVFQESPP